MLHLALWLILTVFMGFGLLTAVIILGTVTWNTAHLVRDVFVGSDGQIWCPVHKQMMTVHGVPRGSILAPFVALDRCSEYGAGRIRCGKTCLVQVTKPERLAA
jgi:hypothetical protein